MNELRRWICGIGLFFTIGIFIVGLGYDAPRVPGSGHLVEVEDGRRTGLKWEYDHDYSDAPWEAKAAHQYFVLTALAGVVFLVGTFKK